MLKREGREALAQACFDFLSVRAALISRAGQTRTFSRIERRQGAAQLAGDEP
jgi:hypothetical protein